MIGPFNGPGDIIGRIVGAEKPSGTKILLFKALIAVGYSLTSPMIAPGGKSGYGEKAAPHLVGGMRVGEVWRAILATARMTVTGFKRNNFFEQLEKP